MFVRISRNEGGEVGFVVAEAGGISARLAGREAVMMESVSSSSKADEGRDEGLEDGREDGSPRNCVGGIGVGEVARALALGMRPVLLPGP